MENPDTTDTAANPGTPAEKARATPGKMTTYLGKWESRGDGTEAFVVLKKLEDATPAKIRAALLDLGAGTYTKLTGRSDTVAYATKTVNSFSV